MKKFMSLIIAMACSISAAQAASLSEGRGYYFDFENTEGVINFSKFNKITDGAKTRQGSIENGVLKMESMTGDKTMPSFVQLEGTPAEYSGQTETEEVIRYSFEVKKEGFGAEDIIYVENNLVSDDFKSITSGSKSYRPINLIKITDGSVKFWGENGTTEKQINGVKLEEQKKYKFDLLLYRDMGIKLFINGIQYTSGYENLQNGRYYTQIKNDAGSGTIDTGSKNITLSSVGGILKLYMVPNDSKRNQTAYFDNISVERMSEAEAMSRCSKYALCSSDFVVQPNDITVGELKKSAGIDAGSEVKVYYDCGITAVDDSEKITDGMKVEIFANYYTIRMFYGSFAFTKNDDGKVLAAFYTNAPRDMQIYAAHFDAAGSLKGIKAINIDRNTGVRRIKTTTDQKVAENETVKLFGWDTEMNPIVLPKVYLAAE